MKSSPRWFKSSIINRISSMRKMTSYYPPQLPALPSASHHFHENNSDKIYHVAIKPKDDGYSVTFAYKRRGNTLNIGTEIAHPTHHS